MNAKIFSGVSAIYYAIQRGIFEIIQDKYFILKTILTDTLVGYVDIVRLLIENGVDIESTTIFDDTALMLAARNGNRWEFPNLFHKLDLMYV